MAKTLRAVPVDGTSKNSSFVERIQNMKKSSDYSLDLGSEDDDLKAVEQQLAAEDGITLESESGNNKTYDVSVASKPASEMTDEELAIAKEALKKRETTIGEKTTQNGEIKITDENGKRLDAVAGDKPVEVPELGGTITNDSVKLAGMSMGFVKYEGELGSFVYNPKEWALGTKEVKDDASGVTTTIPVLRYIAKDNSDKKGNQVYGGNIVIPDGLKSLDYSFENNKDLETIPKIPDSVESAHAAFKNCTKAKRAAKNAKTGEYDGSTDTVKGTEKGAVVGVAGGAVSGAGIGATIGAFGGPIGAGAGAGVGAVVGVIGGAISGAISGHNKGKKKDGKGGTWDMSDGLKDASEMFAGCTNLTESYESAGDNLINARNMYEGTTKLGTDKTAIKLGSTSITDFNSDSKLSKEAVQDSFTGTNVELTDELKGNYSKDWDEDTQTLNKSGITSEEKKEVEDLNQTLQEHDAVFGEISNDMTAQTDGLASSAVVRTAHGTRSTTDVTETNEVLNNNTSSGAALIDRGIVSLGEFWILKKVTGNMLVAGVATFGLQAVGVLPKSMKPILDAVTGFVGKDSAVGKVLSKVSDKLPSDTVEQTEKGKTNAEKTLTQEELAQDAKEKDSSDKTNSTVDERLASDMNTMKVASNSNKVIDVSNSMAINGKAIAKGGVLLTAANKADNDKEFQNVQALSMTMAAALEEKAQSMAVNGELSDDNKKLLASQCMNVMNGMDAYDNGALSQVKSMYGENTADANKAVQGLGKIMYASTTPFVDAIKDMDAKYSFLSDADKEALNSIEITGVSNYSAYQVGDIAVQNGSYADIVSEDDMSMYANAGIDDDIEISSEANTGDTGVRGFVNNLTSIESRVSGQSKQQSQSNRGAMAESMFGDIVESQSDNEYGLQ